MLGGRSSFYMELCNRGNAYRLASIKILTITYAISVNSASTTNLTFDLNGNMTSDGTNSYSWDAENRMIKITYPGVNNFSTFMYDGLSRNVSIVETTAGSVTSTKQFVWNGGNKAQEERDGTGTIIKKFFVSGQTNSGTNYFYTADHLANPTNLASQFQQTALKAGMVFSPAFTSSIREMTNTSGIIQSQMAYDPFGRAFQLQGTISPDFQFGDYYSHARSGLNLTLTRAYSSSLGRFINRDFAGEFGGVNLFRYMENHPVLGVDPSGRCAIAVGVIAASPEAAIAAGALGAAAVGQAAALGNTIDKLLTV